MIGLLDGKPTMQDNKVQRRSLVEQVADILRLHIERGDWPIDQRIPTEPELVLLTGASRNTVREAVRALTFSGMLEVKQGDGSYVRCRIDPTATMRTLGLASLREHLELRCLLEVEAARLAAQRCDAQGLLALRQALAHRGERQGEQGLEAFIARDVAFHRKIADIAGNGALAALYGFFAISIEEHLATALRDSSLPEPSHAEHADIVEAIAQGDVEAAARAARAVTEPTLRALARWERRA